MIKKNKGYSLIEIAVGILMLTIFLLVSIGLFNGCYNNYRRIKQRNIAIDRAVYYMENMLQTDADVLTGFFVQKLVQKTGQSTPGIVEDDIYEYDLQPSTVFHDFVNGDITGSNTYGIKERYAAFKGIPVSDVGGTLSDLDEYIFKDREYLINAYIKKDISAASSEQKKNGSYGFIVNEEDGSNSARYAEDEKYNIVINNERIEEDSDYEYVTSNGGAFKVVKTISRIPVLGGKAYGNNVLRLKVDVYYSKDFSNTLSDSNMDVITINTIKL